MNKETIKQLKDFLQYVKETPFKEQPGTFIKMQAVFFLNRIKEEEEFRRDMLLMDEKGHMQSSTPPIWKVKKQD